MGKKKSSGGGEGNQSNAGEADGEGSKQEKKVKILTRPNPPTKVNDPMPSLSAAMKSLGELQVIVTKTVNELDTKRQAEYIAAVAAFEAQEAAAKTKQSDDKKKARELFEKREVVRLKKKLESRPCKPDPELHPMAVPSIIANVLAHLDPNQKVLKDLGVVCKAWVLPVRAKLFKNLHDLKVGSKARCDGLIELLTSKEALVDVVRAITFSFQPEDPSVPKLRALQDSLPTPVQWLLLLTICSEAKQLSFTNMAAFGATRIILNHISQRIETFSIDPKGYAWHVKEIEFGHNRERSILADWSGLKELSIARSSLRIWPPGSASRHAAPKPAQCPLTNLSLEKVRLNGCVYHMLEGAFGKLSHLKLSQLGSLDIRDLCRTLASHAPTLTHLFLVGNQVTQEDSDDEDYVSDSTSRHPKSHRRGSSAGSTDNILGLARHAAFDRALGSCINLVSLSIEPGNLPVFQPGTLFRTLSKLETLEFNKNGADAWDVSTWVSLLGLLPILVESQCKMKRLHFGHDWNSDDRRLRKMEQAWARQTEKVIISRMG